MIIYFDLITFRPQTIFTIVFQNKHPSFDCLYFVSSQSLWLIESSHDEFALICQ